MNFRKTTPPLLYLTPSPEQSPRCSTVLSDCDADDEATMYSVEEFIPSRPLSVATSHQQPSGPYCPRRPTLQDVLSNTAPPPWTLSAFTAYLSQNHCLETLEFTMDAERYQLKYDKLAEQMAGMPMSRDMEECEYVRMLWQRLLDAYIVPDGPREVNLPSNVRDRLLSIPNHTAPPPPDALDDAVKIIYELMDESVLVPFLNEVSSHRGARSYNSTWDDSDENVHMHGSLDERRSIRRSTSSKRRRSPSSSSLDNSAMLPLGGSTARPSTTSNLTVGLGRGRHSNFSTAGADAGLTDDSGISSSPGKDSPMTPPTTPPSSDFSGSSPRSRSDVTWRKMTGMTGRLGWKKKSSSGMRDSRFPTIEDEGNI